MQMDPDQFCLEQLGEAEDFVSKHEFTILEVKNEAEEELSKH